MKSGESLEKQKKSLYKRLGKSNEHKTKLIKVATEQLNSHTSDR